MSLLERYRTVFRAAWSERHRLAPARRLASERAFLPAALELEETPPSPTARRLLWGTIGFIGIVLLWSVVGRLDIVAVAPGKVVPAGQVKVLQPYERAVVRRLHVRDGMQVKKGQLLIELDATELDAERQKVQASLADAALAAGRARALLAALQSRAAGLRLLAPADGLPADRLAEANRLLVDEYQAFRRRWLASDAEALHLAAQRATTAETLNKLLALQPLQEQRTADLLRLLEKNYVPRHEYLEQESRRTETATEIEVQRKRLLETEALIVRQREQHEALLAGFVRETRSALVQAEQQLAQWGQEQVKLRSRSELLALRAPVDGTVQQLAVHTEGGVVTAAQALLVLVPADEPLEVDAMMANKDIGFIRAGQVAEIKVEAFPFTRFGTLRGTVGNVSLDAVADEAGGLLYQARVRLDRAAIDVEGRAVPLVPGMAVTVEVKTGTRRVIDYFLSPVLQYGSESIRER